MEINYYPNGDKTIGIATNTSGFTPKSPLNEILWSALFSQYLSKAEHLVLADDSRLKATATLNPADEFDEQIGKCVARDRLVIKQCERTDKKLDILQKYINIMQENIDAYREANDNKKERAEQRLEQY